MPTVPLHFRHGNIWTGELEGAEVQVTVLSENVRALSLWEIAPEAPGRRILIGQGEVTRQPNGSWLGRCGQFAGEWIVRAGEKCNPLEFGE